MTRSVPNIVRARTHMAGIIRAALALLAGLVPLADAHAQTTQFPYPMPALEITPHVAYLPVTGTYLSSLTYTRLASPDQLDPDLRGTGRVETVVLAVGTTTTDLETFDLRWRAGLIDMDLVRTPLSMGLTLFDFNRAGWLDTDFRWVNLRLGPSLYLGSERTFLSVRAIGSAGLTTVKMGDALYDGLGPEIRERRRSYELGYLGDVSALLWGRVSLQGVFSYRTMLGGGRPQIYRLHGTAGVRLARPLVLHLIYTVEEARMGRSKVQQDAYGALIRVLI